MYTCIHIYIYTYIHIYRYKYIHTWAGEGQLLFARGVVLYIVLNVVPYTALDFTLCVCTLGCRGTPAENTRGSDKGLAQRVASP